MRYRYWVIMASGLFAIGLIIGLIIAMTKPPGVVSFFSEQLSSLEEMGTTLDPFQASTAIFIYFKNVAVLIFSFIFSPVLCLLPVLALVLNGSLLSFVAVLVSQEKSAGFLLSGVLPHGIIEIPAIIIGEAAALSFGVMTIVSLLSSKKYVPLLPVFKQNLKYLLLALVLLVPAAIIETYVTPLFLS
jgi:stage II sporulation protein M